jgi:hypothetical protein
MKHLFWLFGIGVWAITVYLVKPATDYDYVYLNLKQGDSYTTLWKKVDSLDSQGLPKSAYEVVEKIMQRARNEKNYTQEIKAWIYSVKYLNQLEEYGFEKTLKKMEESVVKMPAPSRQIMHSMMGEIYWMYYNNNRYSILDRSYTSESPGEDIAAWDARTLLNRVLSHYSRSLMQPDSLQKIKIEIFDDILNINQKESRSLRPTIYDFLAHRAIDFYSNSESGLTQPADQYIPDDPKLFSPAAQFAFLSIESKDSLSLTWHSLKTMQKLLSFHHLYKNPDVLTDADLKRLKFVYNNSPLPEKDSLYMQALLMLKERFSNDSASGWVSYEIALMYQKIGYQYHPKNKPEYKWYHKKAADECTEVINKFPGSWPAANCKALLSGIQAISFQTQCERYSIPDKPTLVSIQYQNLNKLNYIIYKSDARKLFEKTKNKSSSEVIEYISTLPLVSKGSFALTVDGDFQNHTAEAMLPSLPIGEYAIVFSYKDDIKTDTNAVSYFQLSKTWLSYYFQMNEESEYTYYVLNRESGLPEQGVTAEMWKEEYDYRKQEYVFTKLQSFTTDINGSFSVPATKNYRYFRVHLTKGTDRLYSDDYLYQYEPYKSKEQFRTVTYFFTDRAIYRPGQTLFFKGIVIETDGKTNRIKPNHTSTVILYDVNFQKTGELKLTTNEYGTFNGTFTLPSEGLAGNMSLSCESGSTYFSVEEYKRPAFEATFEPVKESYKLNAVIKVKGKAMSYSGVPIDGASVSYKITRQAWYPYRYYWGWYPPLPSETVMGYGTSKTGDDGSFDVEFTAKPDLSLSPKYKPAFWYTVTADVTDINGETHSTSHAIAVGYESFYLTTNVYNNINTKDPAPLKLYATNLSGQPIEASGTFNISQVLPPDKYFSERPWEKPEFTLFSEKELNASYPYLPFSDENSMNTWPKGKKVMSNDFKIIPGDTTYKGYGLKLPAGYYYLEAKAKDKNGEEVKYEQYFQVFEPKNGSVVHNDLFLISPVKTTCEPGEKAAFLVKSMAKDVKVLYQIEHNSRIVKKEWLTLSGEQRLIEIPVEEVHRGNFSVHFTVIKHARMYNFNETVHVPFTNKMLDIKFETFRSKLYPGEEEEWKLTIKDKKGDKMAAEMMATLYDASLDAFRNHYWYFWLNKNNWSRFYTQSGRSFSNTYGSFLVNNLSRHYPTYGYSYDDLNWFGFYMGYGRYGNYRGGKHASRPMMAMQKTEGREEAEAIPDATTGVDYDEAKPGKKDKGKNGDGISSSGEELQEKELDTREGQNNEKKEVQIRTNLNETAFFYPNIYTNEKGEFVIKFRIPEALTKWKMLGLAHTKDLKTGTITNELVTQKDLMVVPNLPRFFRENDKITLTTKIQNVSETSQNGTAKLELFDAASMKPVDIEFGNTKPAVTFQSPAGKSVNVSWDIRVPESTGAVVVRITAVTDKFSDGEERPLPVLSNRMLVTETLPLPMKNKGEKSFTFEKLTKSGSSSTLKHHKLTLEFTSNPAWYAIQALPYMMEYPYECSEQVFTRFYANTIATHIANSAPKIKRVFEIWRTKPDSKALLSNLEKNQELKSLLLEETPWVLDAQDESERKRRVALLFDLNHMAAQTASALKKLEKLQTSNGGWAWFPGGRDDRYITQHIMAGMGHLQKLGMINTKTDNRINGMIKPGLDYLDREIRKEYEELKKWAKKEDMAKDHLSYFAIHYLYTRTFFINDFPVDSKSKEAWDYYLGQAKKYWLRNHLYSEGMIALALHRTGDKETSAKMIKSLKERSITHEELGMYWKENTSGYYWWQAPIETHSLLTEAFNDIENDLNTVNELRTWLLKQKQVQDWKTTKATAEAVYALLLRGTDWLNTESSVVIHLGKLKVDPREMPDVKEEAGTGYFKTSWDGSQVTPDMGNIKVTKGNDGVSWGAVYWQYFEQLDKITPHETPLKLNKKLFIERMTDRGTVIEPFKEGNHFTAGDKIIVRIELRVDRNMEYVHMKDMRASGFEPINVISRYKWQDGLGYYESTRDAATNFFFNYLPKGTYVFEYPLRASLAGDFSNGITTIQCMYAPEFTSHSEGIRLIIK